MRRPWLLVGILAIVASLCLGEFQSAQAQRFRRGGGGYSGWSGGYYNGYNYPGYWGRGYYGGYNYPGYWGSGYYGGYYNPGYRNYDYDMGYYDNWGYGQNEAFYPDFNQGYQQGYGNYQQGDFQEGYQGNLQDRSMPQGQGRQAVVMVRVPDPNAQVWFGSHRTQQGGMQRTFESPPLEQGTYSYEVRAKWNQNGQDMSQTRKVTVRPGQRVMVDFTRQGQGSQPGERLNNPPTREGNQPSTRQNDQSNRDDQNRNQNRDQTSPRPPQ